jgi:hypothetical protein
METNPNNRDEPTPQEPPKSFVPDESREIPVSAQRNWTSNLIILLVSAIVGMTIVHYGVCMGKYRWMEWEFYKELITREGIEKVDQVDLKYLTDPTCEDANRVSIGTLTALLATILALRVKGS